jgi:hypothetical protein
MRGVRNISSKLTLPNKVILPSVWFAACVRICAPLWLPPGVVHWQAFRGLDNPLARASAMIGFPLIFAWTVWSTSRLKRVRLDGDELLVSNYHTEIRIPLSRVALVELINRGRSGKFGVIDLDATSAFGDSITFLPVSTQGALGFEYPIIDELNRLAQQARGHRSVPRPAMPND